MLQLTSASDLIRVVTSAAADIEAHVSYVNHDAGAITPARTNTASIVTATTTTILASPASGQHRVVLLSLRNNHGSTACDVTVRHEDGTEIETLIKVTLLAGEALVMDRNGKWTHYAVDGGEYPLVPSAASRTEMEAATSLVVASTPGRQHYHPGHPKFWCHAIQTTGIVFLLDSYNLTSLTDTGPGRLTHTIAADMASTSYAIQAMVQRPGTSLSVSSLKYCNVRNATQAVGSFEVEVYDGTAVTHVQEDTHNIYAMALGDAA